MDTNPKVPVTQRAYTLRLRGLDPDDHSWRDALWATHEAVNKGARAFGDWLLTLRGGLDHNLASGQSAAEQRIILALGWLSVEDAQHAAAQYCVAAGTDSQSVRNDKVLSAFRDILVKRELATSDIDDWMKDCAASLCSAIREDAIWVNRSAAFDAASHLPGLTRDHARIVLEDLVGDISGFLALPAGEEGGQTEQPDSKDFVIKACGWLSFNCGEGEKSDKKKLARNLQVIGDADLGDLAGQPGSALLPRLLALLEVSDSGNLAQTPQTAIRNAVGWRGGPVSKGLKAIQDTSQRAALLQDDLDRLRQKLLEEASERRGQIGKSPVPWAGALKTRMERGSGFEYTKSRFAVMLDHALRRFSSTHTWLKRAEASRRRFDEDAAKIDSLHSKCPDAVQWLDDFCERRTTATGAGEGGYRMRKRALGGKTARAWKTVLAGWSDADCETEAQRIDVVGEVQRQWEDDEKFGHSELFEELAGEDARCVWERNGQADPQILIDYIAARTAEFDRRRYRVPMYRHPDALLHPVFCDYGNSRWSVRFQVQRDRLRNASSSKGSQKTNADNHGMELDVLLSGEVASQRLRWASKRLDRDLAIGERVSNQGAQSVTRADRLGRAVGRQASDVEVMNVFAEKEWNGRLQAPRGELERIARLIGRGDKRKAEQVQRRLHWLLSFSPRLQPQGPWITYGTDHALYPPKREISFAPKNEKDSWRGLAYPVWHPDDKGRKGLAKHSLSRLPGLRLLSVDLGHRFAAACAVWETVSAISLRNAVEGKAIICGGAGPDDLFCHVESPGVSERRRAVVYRRIGPDTLDGKAHPAPWARLERQFLIKLPGEERAARAASHDEADRVKQFVEGHGLVLDDDQKRGRRVDELMSRAVRMAMLALRRHARRAKIAWALDPARCSVVGMGGTEAAFEPGDSAHAKLLTDTLVDWHSLASETKWDDAGARKLWNEHVALLRPDLQISERTSAAQATDERSRQQRRKDEDALREQLKPIVERLARSDRAAMHAAWKQQWEAEDGCPAVVSPRTTDVEGRGPARTTVEQPASGWHGDLRWLTDWIMGWHLAGTSSKMWARNLGGLSLTRIATMRALYQLHKAFAMRPTPDKPRGAPERGESNAGVAQRLLDAMERMREQRVKQLASRIAASALGLGGHWKEVPIPRRNGEGKFVRKPDGTTDTQGRWIWVEEPTPKYPACHAVVIENLTNYRPDELQTRRENRQLMSWSSAKVKKYLAEACQLHGLHLREVPASYTSRQDSRTGMPGVRCSEVAANNFATAPWWRRQVNQAEKKAGSDRTERDKYLLRLDEEWSEKPANEQKRGVLCIPTKGGDLFVAAWNGDPAKHRGGIQADLNAAANIGLKALTDPDWPARWWYVPCRTDDGKPAKDKVGGCPIIPDDKPLRVASESIQKAGRSGAGGSRRKGGKPGTKGREREIMNVWRDLSTSDILPGPGWQPTKEYWTGVEERIIAYLVRLSGLDKGVDSATPW